MTPPQPYKDPSRWRRRKIRGADRKAGRVKVRCTACKLEAWIPPRILNSRFLPKCLACGWAIELAGDLGE